MKIHKKMLTLILVIPIIGSIIILLQSHVLNKNIALTTITGSIEINPSEGYAS